MPNSSKLQHPYPAANERDWFSQFETFVESLDAADFSARDDRNLAVINKGTISYTDSGGGIHNVSWNGEIKFFHGSTGIAGTLALDATGHDLEDGDSVYVTLARGPSGPYTLTSVKTVAAVPANSNAYLLFHRDGDLLWVRHSALITVV